MLKKATKRRDKMILKIFLGSGIRVSELVHLKEDHVDIETGYITIFDGKGGKDREIPIPH